MPAQHGSSGPRLFLQDSVLGLHIYKPDEVNTYCNESGQRLADFLANLDELTMVLVKRGFGVRLTATPTNVFTALLCSQLFCSMRVCFRFCSLPGL